MNRCRFIYFTVLTILCISAGKISLEFDENKYKKLSKKIFSMPTDDIDLASISSDEMERKGGNDWKMAENCNAVCVPKYLCVNDRVIVNGAGLLSLRFGAKTKRNCGADVLCCLNENNDDYDEEDNENDNFENINNESMDQKDGQTNGMGCGYRHDRHIKVISNRISSGTITHFGEFPWVIAVGLRLRTREYFEYRGGGSLIHPRVILTAAHILQNKTAENFLVRAGEWDMRNTDEELKHQDRRVDAIVRHPQFEALTITNDIALLIVRQPFVLTQTVNTICLPMQNYLTKHNTKCTASGWGKNVRNGKYQSVLRKVDVPFVGRQECKQQLRRTQLGQYYQLHPSLVCAGGGKKGEDTCDGDGGSPLICKLPTTESRFYQMGIVAGGKF